MKNLFKSAAIAITLTLAATAAFSQTATATASTNTLSDLQAVSSGLKTDLDTAALLFRDQSSALVMTNGYTSTATKASEAVIFQDGSNGFAFIGHDVASAMDNNYASIDQQFGGINNIAYIVQGGTANYASITQLSGFKVVGYISQTGTGNKAVINQQ
jgi:hypothetical protein